VTFNDADFRPANLEVPQSALSGRAFLSLPCEIDPMLSRLRARVTRFLMRDSAVHENGYWRQLRDSEIEGGAHREMVGGMWDEIGELQFRFLVAQGLRPAHRLLDLGCGALRGGIHFARFLDRGHYYGIDGNESLIRAGRRELDLAGLSGRDVKLEVTSDFDCCTFGTQFDYAIAISLFTHLYMNHIVRCLIEVHRALRPGSPFFATFFEAPHPAHIEAIHHTPGGVTTHLDSDPFHYAYEELAAVGRSVGMEAERVGDWQHPRNQKMIRFTRPF